MYMYKYYTCTPPPPPPDVIIAVKTPFFLYVAFQHTHKPQFSGERFTNKTIRGHFGDSLAELDWGVGQVFQALRDAGVDQNTFVFFTSDNG